MSKRKRCLLVIDLFCGCGGLSLGLKRAGFEPVAAFDIDEKALEVYNKNIASVTHKRDISKLSVREMLEIAGVKHLDLIVAAPPCQGVSKQNHGGGSEDERNRLVLEALRVIACAKPRAFLLENVPSLLSRGKGFVREMLDTLGKMYNIDGRIYDCSLYGVAQTRKRFIMVGVRKDVNKPFKIPRPTSLKPLTVGDVIKDLPEPTTDNEIPNHIPANISAVAQRRFSHVPQGGGWKDIPDSLLNDCHKNVKGKSGSWPDAYGRLSWDQPAPTLTAGCHSFTKGRFGHPEQDRPLTPRECARIQGFPDNFVFSKSRIDAARQIGNSVPPPLAEALGKSLAMCLA